MRYQVTVSLTEEDYLAYNEFHAIESIPGQKTVKQSLRFFITLMLVLIATVTIGCLFDVFSVTYPVALITLTALYVLFFKKIMRRAVKSQVKKLKKAGKLPFDATSTYEFYEDKLVENAQGSRIEQAYSRLERICVLKERYILLYNSSIGAYILPYGQLADQVDIQEFLNFMIPKCKAVEYY